MLSKFKADMISDEMQQEILRKHFTTLFKFVAHEKIIPNSAYEKTDGVIRCLTGIPFPYLNAILDCPIEKDQWEESIKKQMAFFNKAKMPFVWYLNEDADPDFKHLLKEHGFRDGGVFRGVMGALDKPIPKPEMPEGCSFELVGDMKAMTEFNDLVCSTFSFQGIAKDLYKTMCWEASRTKGLKMYHWMAKQKGQAVSAVSTLIEDDMVSFWNGATLPELRRQGLSYGLRCMALKDAVAKGCRLGSSYLMSGGMALGICSKFGYQTKWRFNAFLSPS